MTREEAARVLTELADEYEKYELSKNGWLGTTYIPAHRMGVAALRDALQRQPDPDTGLVPCGCGERVSISFYPRWAGTPDLYQVDCFNCHVGTRPCQTAEQAKAAWNTAMGWRVEE